MNKKTKTKGLGDVVKNVTEVLGIEQCDGCIKRQEILNNILPFGTKDNIISDDDKGVLNRIKGTDVKSSTDRHYLFSLYNRVFQTKLKVCQCQDQINDMIEKLLNQDVE